MGAWSVYFLAKVGLYYGHAIGLHWLPNLLLAAALAWPLAGARLRRVRLVLALPLALALLYYDSSLPPLARVLEQAGALGSFRAGYLVELAQRFVSLRWVLALAGLVAAYVLFSHRLRFATLAILGLLVAAVAPAAPPSSAPDAQRFERPGEPIALGPEPAVEPRSIVPLTAAQLDQALADIAASQKGKSVSFQRAGPARFDLVLLSICSLAVDDLDMVHMRQDPLLRRFDIVFRQFNSAATYSGPAVLRLLHGTCGQARQAELYGGGAPNECYLFRNLAGAGYRPALLLNHDGRFDDFGGQLRAQGGLDADPEDNRFAPVIMNAFDGSPLRDDQVLLTQWWRRHASGDGHVALLYNTISLHDGNRAPGMGGASSLQTYGPRLRRLFADLGRFIDEVEASGRPTVIVLVPEHGAALRGDAVQVPGLRELPTPAITQVPAAVKLVGFSAVGRPGQQPIVVERTASYLDLMVLVAGLVRSGPAQTTPDGLLALTHALPPAPWVAENEGNILLRQDGRSYLRAPAGEWTEYAAAPLP